MPRLSAGRVQSVATRLVVERERERMAFRAAAWWDLAGHVRSGDASTRGSSPSRGSASPAGATSGPTGSCVARRRQLDEEAARGLADRLAGLVLPGRPRRAQAVRPSSQPAVHDLDAAAGGEPQAPLLRADDDAHRAAPVRERLHHLHAHRLDDVVGVGAHGRSRAGRVSLRRPTTSRRNRAATSGRSRTRRRHTRRSGPRATASARRRTCAPSSRWTSTRSTS